MEAAPSAKPRREPPPIPPHYVSLRKLQELRLKEQEEKRRREEEEAAAAAAAAKRDAALKEAAKGRAVSCEAPRGAKDRPRGGQGQGHQWVPSAHRAPAAVPRPTPTCGEVVAVDRGRAVGGGRGKKGPGEGDVADSAPRGGCEPLRKGKGKGKGKASSCHTVDGVDEAGKLAEAAPASSDAGKPEDKSKPKASGDQTAQSRSTGGPGEPAKAAAASSRHHFKRKGRKGAGGRGAETSAGDAPAKSAGLSPSPSPPRGVKSDNNGKPKPSAPRRADSGTVSDSTDGKKAAAPAKAPPTSAADGSSKSTGDGELRKAVEAKPRGLVEVQRRRQVVEVQAVAELNPRAVTKWAEPRRRDRGIEAAEQHGRVWVPKAASAAATGSSAGAGL